MRDPASCIGRSSAWRFAGTSIQHAVGWPEIAQRMTAVPQCLAIVNVRDHASQLYEEVLRVGEEKGLNKQGVFHLSTRMCASHRLRVLDKIRLRLTAGESCHVVSTQLVEAGVDVDFPLVLRALAPLIPLSRLPGALTVRDHRGAGQARWKGGGLSS